MSPSSGAQNPQLTRKPAKASSHTYFSRLSRRFFGSSASTDPRDPPPQRALPKPPQRLCSLKRKSNSYFAKQARNLSPSPDLEIPGTSSVDLGRDKQIRTKHQTAVSGQGHTPALLGDTPVSELRPRPINIFGPSDKIDASHRNTSIIHPADAAATPKSETMDDSPIDLAHVDVSPHHEPSVPPAQPTTSFVTMKRPLPPPKSRDVVRKEAKRAREVINLCDGAKDAEPAAKRTRVATNLCDDAEDSGSAAKRARTIINLCDDAEDSGSAAKKATFGAAGDWLQPAIRGPKSSVHVPGTTTLRRPARNERAEEQRLQQELAVEGEGGGRSTHSSATNVRNGEAGAPNASTTPRKKKKKLFGTLSANDASATPQHPGATPSTHMLSRETVNPGLDAPVAPRLVAGNPFANSTNGAIQSANSQSQTNFQSQADGRFVDEGYGSLSVPGADDLDRVPDNENELIKRINGSLGRSSPFAQGVRRKAPRVVTPQQAYAEQQRDLDVQRSRRMREANLAAKEQKAKLASNGGGGLSVAVLEDLEPTASPADLRSTRCKLANTAGARSEPRKDLVGLVNGGSSTLVNDDGPPRTPDLQTSNAHHQGQGQRAHTALLDIAEDYARTRGLHVAVKTTQRSSATAKPAEKPMADSKALGSRDGNVTHTGFTQPLEQQLKNGENGEGPTRASDAASSPSTISQPPPEERKRQEVDTLQPRSTAGPHEAGDGRLPAAARLLERGNTLGSGNTSPAVRAPQHVRKDGGLLDQPALKNEEQEQVLLQSAEPSDLDRSSPLIKVRPTAGAGHNMSSKRSRTNHNKRAKHAVENAEAALLRMGLPASVFGSWQNRRKCFWAGREDEFRGRRRELKELVTKYSNNATSKARTSDKRPSGTVAAAEALLRDLGYDGSLLKRLSNKTKSQWARLETELTAKRRIYGNFRAKQDAQEWTPPLPGASKETRSNEGSAGKDASATADEGSGSDESEEDEGWQYAIRWQGIERPKTAADSVPLTTTVVTKHDTVPEESAGDEHDRAVEGPDVQGGAGAAARQVETPRASPEHFPNRQKPDADLLRQMQRKRYDDWSDDEADDVHEYVVKAETWGMTDLPADDVLILGRFLDRDRAEAMVREFILRCKPPEVGRTLEIQSRWSDGNFSQTMIRDGEAGCRAFVEAAIVSARQYPGLRDKVARRTMYAVRFERTTSTKGAGGVWEEDVKATTVDDLPVFTTKSLANWHAKKQYQEWYTEYLPGPQNRCWLRMHDDDLCKHVEELNDEGLLFCREECFETGGATDTIKVWVQEMAPKGPRN